jgi:hypothetical protein
VRYCSYYALTERQDMQRIGHLVLVVGALDAKSSNWSSPGRKHEEIAAGSCIASIEFKKADK